MHLGIMQFDTVRDSLRPQHGNYPLMIQNLLANARDDLSFSIYNYPEGESANRPDDCDAWLTTGSKWSVYDEDDWIARAQEFVTRIHAEKRPLVAICFGHQLITQALGGTVGRADVGWGVGVHTAEVYQHKPWMVPAVDRYSLLVSHQDQVLAPPAEAEHLAGHEFCPYDMLQIGNHVLTFQGHPEFVPEYSRALLEIRRDELDENVWKTGMQSLENPIDRQLSANWILRFIEQAIASRGGEGIR